MEITASRRQPLGNSLNSLQWKYMYLNKELFSVGTQSKDVIQKMPTEKNKKNTKPIMSRSVAKRAGLQ